VWFLTAQYPVIVLSPSFYAPRAIIAPPHEFPLDAVRGAVREFAYLAAYVHIVLLSHEDTTILDIVNLDIVNLDIVLGCDPHHLLPSPC
jgi:hypothetical protein